MTPAVSCPKCGGTDIHTAYHKQGCDREGCGCATCSYDSHAKEHREHLHRFCRTCSFDWLSPTLETDLVEVIELGAPLSAEEFENVKREFTRRRGGFMHGNPRAVV